MEEFNYSNLSPGLLKIIFYQSTIIIQYTGGPGIEGHNGHLISQRF
jgi:hypothetical protein